eukprot:767109-Hanusia_phi.AAC.5
METNLENLWDSEGRDNEEPADRNEVLRRLPPCLRVSFEVLDILEFRSAGCTRPSPPRAKDFKAASKDAVQFKLENPLNHIKSLKKVVSALVGLGSDAVQAGEGSSGSVYVGDRLSDGKRIAVKRKARHGSSLEIGKQTNIPALENEIAMMTLSKHPNISVSRESYRPSFPNLGIS